MSSPDRGPEPAETTRTTSGSAEPDQPRTESTMDARTGDVDDTPTARLDSLAHDERADDAEQHPGAPTAPADARDHDERGVRVGTVVWGLVIAAIGVGLIATVAGARFDVELAVIALVAAAGVALLVGSVAKSLRRR